ncbi:hypothetical protein MA16_Dca026422 [Dendrobium catenatum]|uniref:Uncharacterized protein n=1 Tax=Dendrobium catenatum TaxID=906689 RepID=A0A2I0XJ06_9ASPA|nr:hypothetical protein MA16_Dca026422 [Dendrobium catenatum]
MSIRSTAYSHEQDKLLCIMYMEIAQDPITGVYQSSDNFWSCVEQAYNNSKIQSWEICSKRSVQSHIHTIEKATRKMHACIRQVENRHISGASNEDIISIYVCY